MNNKNYLSDNLIIGCNKRYVEYNRIAKPKNTLGIILTPLIIFISIVLFPKDQLAQPASYELVCRGGGNLYFNYTPFSNFSPEPQIWITFERASQGVGNNWENLLHLMPGQCTWKGRPVSNTEPDRILIKIRANEFSIAWSQEKVMGISSSLNYINNLRDANRYQSFFVYNDRDGNFIVTSIGQSR